MIMALKYFKYIYVFIIGLFMLSCSNNIYLGKGLLESGKTTKINVSNWKKLKIGMNKSQVKELLGESQSEHIISVGNSEDKSSTYEYWEYGYKSGALSSPHPKAYVIYFDSEGLISKLREPLSDDNEEKDEHK